MENKVKYVYQLSLANGKVLINEGDGIFSVDNPEKPNDKILVNAAVLIKVIDEKVEDDMLVQDAAEIVEQDTIEEEQ